MYVNATEAISRQKPERKWLDCSPVTPSIAQNTSYLWLQRSLNKSASKTISYKYPIFNRKRVSRSRKSITRVPRIVYGSFVRRFACTSREINVLKWTRNVLSSISVERKARHTISRDNAPSERKLMNVKHLCNE